MKVKRGRKERISGHAPFGWERLNDRGIQPKRAIRWLRSSVLRIVKRAA
jgi:hypothetical protein